MDKFLNKLWVFVKYLFGSIAGVFGAISQILTGFLTFLMGCTIICAIIGSFVYVKVRPEFEKARATAYDKLASMDENDFTMRSDTNIYDKDGNLIGIINAGHYEYADITEISPYIQNGYIAVEDRRYKQHFGIDYISIMRAFVALVKNDGEITQGGSTITQQVVKNTMLTQEQTFSRKLIEIMIAPYVEQRFGKDKVMEFYCNTNFYGNRCYGVQAASRYYFGKDAKDLEVWEAALLVGLSNSPSAYDPVKHPDKALEKRNRVLDTMLKEGYIEESTCKIAKEQPLNIVQEYAEGTRENYQSSYAIHCAALELMKNDGFEFKYTFKDKAEYEEYKENYSEVYQMKSEDIRSGGYDIYTTLDSNIQNVAQSRLDSTLARFKDTDEKTGRYLLQGAAVVVDNNSNNVVAIVGGRGTEDAFNRGYQAVRQPGSTIKPIIDYGPAFDTGEYYPSKIINDHKWEGGPSNSGSYRGNVTIREALNRSLNTVAWQVLQGIGVDKGLEYLDKLQFMNLSYVDNGVEALSIGGFTNGARVVDMAKAYSTLANDGIYNDKTCITSIIYKEQEVYKDRSKDTRVYGEDTSYMLTDILKGTMDMPYGTGHGLDIPGQQAAGKTGTTNSNKDAWFCGYTKYYTTAVWMGYDTPKAMPGVYGATYAGKIWQDIMTDIHNGLPELDWEMPGTVYRAPYDGNGNETSINTGQEDLFSSTGKIRADEARSEREAKAKFDEASKLVEKYEGWFINSVEDTYLVAQKYNEVKTEVSLLKDDTNRKLLMERVAAKNDALQNDLVEWAATIAEFEANKEKAEAESLAAEAELAEENRLKLQKEQDILTFRNALKVISDMKYKDDRQYNNAVDSVKLALEDCIDYSEYASLADEFSKAIDNYNMLPTREEWQVKENERLAEEARKKEEEARKNAEIAESLADKLNDKEDAIVIGPDATGNSNNSSNIGPGMNLGPNGEVGPGFQ